VLPAALDFADAAVEEALETIEEMAEPAAFDTLAIADVALAALEATEPVALLCVIPVMEVIEVVMALIDWAATMAGRMKTVKRMLRFSANNQLLFFLFSTCELTI
jgi:hypothetical protein